MRAGRRRQRILVAGRVAVAQLQAVPVHVLPGGQAHVTAARPPAAAAQRDGQLVRRGLLDAHQLVHRAAVDGQRAAGARARRVPVPVGAGHVDVRPRPVGRVPARVARVLRAPTPSPAPAAPPSPPGDGTAAHRAHKRR